MSRLGIISKLVLNFRFRELSNLAKAYINLKREPLLMSSEPVFLQYESANTCNLTCVMCEVNKETESKRKKTVSSSDFKIVLRQFPYVRSLILSGAGEPTLSKDLVKNIIFSKERGISVGFHTNGLLVDKELAKRIINSKLDWITFSIDSASKEKYERIRMGSNFEKVVSNLKHLLELKRDEDSRIRISVLMVAMKNNVDEAKRFVEYFERLGVKDITMHKVHVTKRYPEKRRELEVVDVQTADAKIREAEMHAKKLGVNVRITTFFSEQNDKRRCNWPWFGPYITADGYVTPCCVINNPSWLNFGNVLKEDFSDIWNNAKYIQFRKELKSARKPKLCEKLDCPYYNTSLF